MHLQVESPSKCLNGSELLFVESQMSRDTNLYKLKLLHARHLRHFHAILPQIRWVLSKRNFVDDNLGLYSSCPILPSILYSSGHVRISFVVNDQYVIFEWHLNSLDLLLPGRPSSGVERVASLAGFDSWTCANAGGRVKGLYVART